MNTTMRVPSALRRHAARLLLPLVAATLLLAAGCAPSSGERALGQAEAVMEEHPDSALAILQAVDGADLSGELRARHALLLSQALDKNFIDIADDSIISVAYDYYGLQDEVCPRYRMMSFYYRGVVDFNKGDHSGALFNFFIADTLAARLQDFSFRGLANSRMAISFGEMADLQRELEHSLLALQFFRLEGDSTHISNQLYSVGLAFNQVNLFDSAMVYFARSDYELKYRGIASALIKTDSLERFAGLQTKYPSLATDSRIQSRYAGQLVRQGRYDDAMVALARARDNMTDAADSILWANSLAILHKKQNDWKAYAADLEFLIHDNISHDDTIKEIYMPSSMSSARDAVALYDIRREERKSSRLTFWLTVAVLLTVITALVSVMVFRAARQKTDRQLLRLAEINAGLRRKNDHTASRLRTIEEERDVWSDRAGNLQQQLLMVKKGESRAQPERQMAYAEFIIERKQNLESLFQKLVSIPSHSHVERRDMIRREINSYNSVEFADRTDGFIDLNFGNFMTRAKAMRLHQKDLALLRLLICGFSRPQIGVILDIDPRTVSTRKCRLKDKLAKGGINEIPTI